MKKYLIAFFLGALLMEAQSQIIQDYLGDESDLYAATKQVNQFFRRFYGEEDFNGERYYPEDKYYRDSKLRKTYLENLFNNENPFITPALKDNFIEHVMAPQNPVYLDFLGGAWFAEVTTRFTFRNEEKFLTLFLQHPSDSVCSPGVM